MDRTKTLGQALRRASKTPLAGALQSALCAAELLGRARDIDIALMGFDQCDKLFRQPGRVSVVDKIA